MDKNAFDSPVVLKTDSAPGTSDGSRVTIFHVTTDGKLEVFDPRPRSIVPNPFINPSFNILALEVVNRE